MESFYGGKQGSSFVIVETFPSIVKMVESFKQGPEYSAVHYDEYVLINTENKNNPENGNLYRRGYDYTNDMGGAIFIGSLVGPAGKAPQVSMGKLEDVAAMAVAEDVDAQRSSGSFKVQEGLVPGKIGEDYNDEIKWTTCSIRTPDGADTVAYVGFEIPYPVIEFEGRQVDAYVTEGFITRADDGTHPFYSKWNINIPKGVKGDALTNFRVIEADDSVHEYSGQADDITNRRKILVYDYTDYSKSEQGETSTLYLGDYNQITDVILDDDGTFTLKYSHNNTQTYNKKLKWIDEVTLGQDGRFVTTYNTGARYETSLAWVKDLRVAADGTITVDWSTGDTVDLDAKIKWITSMQMSADGTVYINYNDGSSDTFDKEIQWVSNISLAENGDFTVQYNNGTPAYKTKLIWAKDIDFKPNGTVEIVYNNGEKKTYNKLFKYLDKMYVQDDTIVADPDYKLHVIYNTGEDVSVGDAFNFVQTTAIDPKDFHLLVYYTNAAARKSLISAGVARTYNGLTGWADLGAVKADSGILIGTNIEVAEEDDPLLETEKAVQHLNEKYPNGLTGDLKGKVVTIGMVDKAKKFYGFDYNTKEDGGYVGWYYVGSFSGEDVDANSSWIEV